MAEIAAGLELPAPAVCYHINLLLKARLIRTTTKGRKTYYSLNRKQIDAISKYLKLSFAEENSTD
jgi:DNA-binding transcriptional ArsR family regulator